jgi:hypothetical protein
MTTGELTEIEHAILVAATLEGRIVSAQEHYGGGCPPGWMVVRFGQAQWRLCFTLNDVLATLLVQEWGSWRDC